MMTAAPPAQLTAEEPELIGRAPERRLLDTLLAAPTGEVLLMWGEPGIGKSALLRYAAGTTKATVLRTRGVGSESGLPFVALADLLAPLRGHLRELPAVQRRALEVCLAFSADAQVNPYVACAGALNLLTVAGAAGPVVALVDDLQWIDPPSRRVLLFLARRLAVDGVALVLTARVDDRSQGLRHELPSLELTGLSAGECRDLLSARGYRVAGPVADELVRLSGGNPLALLEAAESMRPAQLRGEAPLGDPAGRHERYAWSCRIRELPAATRDALTLLATSRLRSIGVLEAALAAEGSSLAALRPAEQAGLVVSQGASYEFRHPILEPVVLRQAPLAARLVAARALAQVSSGPMRAWYLAATTTEPDEDLAGELVQVARDARRRDALPAAALAWRRAADLTAGGPRRADRLLQAATDAFLGGSCAEAAAWCEDALAATADPLLRADIELLRGRARTRTGQPAHAYQLLADGARAVAAADPGRAGGMLSEAAVPAMMTGRVSEAVRSAEEGHRLAPAPVMLGWARIMAGRVPHGRALLDGSRAELAALDPVSDQYRLALAGQALGWADRPEEGGALLTRVIEAGRQRDAPAALPLALAARGELDLWAGRWAAAYADATEALSRAQQSGQVAAVGYSLVVLARLDALRGDQALCEARVELARGLAGPYGIEAVEVALAAVLGLAALTQGGYDTAIIHLERAWTSQVRHGVHNPVVVPCAGDLAEAYLHAGDTVRAAEVLDELERQAGTTGLAWPAAAAARCRGMLTKDVAQAEAFFDAAESAHRRRDMPFEWARTALCRGEAMRRLRRPAAARAALVISQAQFESLGAAPWARRTQELRSAAGQRVAPAAAPDLDRLSAQELQVARAIAKGMNNQEAACALFVSRKTIEAHLTRVYRKLRVRSRTDLTREMVSAGLVD